MTLPRPWIRLVVIGPLLAMAGCSPPGGTDDATVVPDPSAEVKAQPIGDGKAEIPAPAPPPDRPEQP